MIRNQTNFLMILMIIILTFIPISCSSDHTRLEDHGTYTLVLQENGQALGYSPDSGLKILYEDGFAFKDLNRNEESTLMRIGEMIPTRGPEI